LAPSSLLDQIYLESGLPPPPDPQQAPIANAEKTSEKSQDAEETEALLIRKETPKQISEALELPELELELERALWQVEEANKAVRAKSDPQGKDEKKSE